MEIKGYTLHGNYYLADKVITNVKLEEALKIKEEITLPGKKVIAHTLSKEELETIPREERKCDKWYWTSNSYDSDYHLYVDTDGDFNGTDSDYSDSNGGVRLGFKNPFFLEEER